MKRTLIAGVVGGIVFFIWGMLAWMALPLHMSSMGGLPNESVVTQTLKASGLESGVYAAPWSDNEEDWENPNSAWAKAHLAGPTYTVFYSAEGCAPMDPMTMLGGLLIDILGGLVAAFMLCMALPGCQTYGRRVLFITCLGVFVALIAHLGYWNWMKFSTDWTFAFVVDVIVGWALAGAAMAAILKPTPTTAA